jgi:phytoene dehydrogenase-like protein
LSNNFDAIIIGAGIGGLTCAAFLAKQGMRVAVCEKHSQIGGYAQNFTRKGFTFDSCVHSVSMADSGFICGLLKSLGIRDDLVITPNTCSMHVMTPQTRYSVPADLQTLKELFCRDFPQEKDSIAALLSEMTKNFSRFKKDLGPRKIPPDSSTDIPVDVSELTCSYQEYIARFIKDKTLQHLFYSVWPFAGNSPSYAPIFNALIFIVHALEGSHHVKGGFAALAGALARVVTRNNGTIMTRWPVCGLRIAAGTGKTASAVVNARGEELTARFFVSNISPYILHRSLLPQDARNRLWLKRLEMLRPSVSAVCVYLGIQGDASDIVKDNVTFWFASDDHEAVYSRILSGPPETIDHLLVMRPPDSRHESTMTLIFFARADAVDTWKEAKKTISSAMVQKAFALFGDFSARIRVSEAASPGTLERYTGNTGGALYGFDNARDLYGQSKLPLTTHIRNLYQAGHWTKSGSGIYNVMSSGSAVAAMILNRQNPFA